MTAGQPNLVAEAIEALMVPGAVLGRNSPLTSAIRHRPDGFWSRERVLVHGEITDRYRQIQGDIRTDGLAAVLTAGAPGAGKSHATAGFEGFRSLDADVVKRLLMQHEVQAGSYAQLLSTELSDGYPLMPMEIATPVHLESVYIANAIRTISIDEGENIVMHGSLASPGRGIELLRIITAGGYEKLTIVAVEVPEETAQRQAARRWWEDRIAATEGGDQMGGRYTPRAAIAGLYGPDPSAASRCFTHAVETFKTGLKQDEGVELDLIIYRDGLMMRHTESSLPI